MDIKNYTQGKYSYWRYMSLNELKKYLHGEVIVRENPSNSKTTAPYNSIFFFDDCIKATSTNSEKCYNPFEVLEFCYGVVSDEYLINFRSDLDINKSVGTYADCISPDYGFLDTMEVEERYIDSYSDKTMCLNKVYKVNIKENTFEDVDFSTLIDDNNIWGE